MPANATSTAESFERFRTFAVEDEALCRALEGETDPRAFAILAQRLGAERGFAFTTADVERAIVEGRRSWIER
jgi:hypothetical protein